MNSFSSETSRALSRLRIVAILFLISGCYSAITMLFAPLQGKISIQFGVLGIPIFFGLMKFRPGWRTCALVLIWLGLILIPLIALTALFSNAPAYFKIFGVKIMRVPNIFVALGSIPFFLLAFWQYQVLTDPRVMRLFELGT